MLKVLYDHQMFSLQQYGGISRYFANLYYSFRNADEIDPAISILFTKNHYINNLSKPLPSWAGEVLAKKKKRLYKWNKVYSQRQIRKNDFDLLHPTYYDPYFLKHLKKPFIITVHDMIYELFPQYFEATDKFVVHKRNVIEKADHIIAISESTKRDLQQIYGIADDKVTVVQHGFYPESQTAVPLHFTVQEYILYVGDRSAYKNFETFLQAVAPLFKKNRLLHLVCTGGGIFKTQELELFQQKGIQQRVVQISAGNAELNYLYRHARVFVFPSLYEGFGFPLLEAFSNQCPVAASNTSSFKEVGGKAVAYFNPHDQNDILKAITTIIENETVATKLKEEGNLQLKKFTMEACVAKTADVYRQLISR